MRGSFRFAWAAGIAFFLGWAAGAPDPGVPPLVKKGWDPSPGARAPSLLYIDLIPCRLHSTAPCRTKYGKWIWEADDTALMGRGFRMENVFVDDARYRNMTSEQFKAESASHPADFLDRKRFSLPDPVLEVLSASVFHDLPFAGLSFTYEDDQLREWNSGGVTEARLLEVLNRKQIRDSLSRNSSPESRNPSPLFVPDAAPASGR